MTNPQSSPDHCDVPFQRKFVDEFAQSGIGSQHLLIAPSGTGKGTVAIRIIRRLMQEGQITCGLVLCPASFVGEYESRLSGDGAQLPVFAVDRFRLREWEAAVPPGASSLPESIIAIMSIDLAKQPDVRAILTARQWDVLVVDEAHLLAGQRAEVVRQLLATKAVGRALLMTATPPKEPVSDELSITDWGIELQSVLDRSKSMMQMHWVQVPYSDRETAVLKEVNGLAASLVREGHWEFARILVARANSSFYALEQSVLRLRNRAMHGGVTDVEDQAAAEGTSMLRMDSASPSVSHRLLQTLSALDAVEHDSKLNALLKLIEEQLANSGRRNILIFSHFVNTVEYLTSTLTDRKLEVTGITAGMPADDRMAGMEAGAPGGIIVSTLAAVEGYQFRQADVYVFYEQLKEDESGLYAIHMFGSGGDKSFDVFSFKELIASPSDSRLTESEV